MKKERPIEKDERTKDQIDRGRAIREGLILQTKLDIKNIIEQMSYSIPLGAEYRHLETSLRQEQRFLNSL